ncbi:chorismate mutase [Fodinisporobacter ferrooxydans]|uniref:chorismate mutase n=1 Tax=Fodinisporobacter ferrooxydans TaxID=2901836 RepID=A0ABY4CJT4_9BACL|nr:chorismate mutase [Alicyclobacillaceae bacterium MYW30-H2]
MVRGIRGATTVEQNEEAEILHATRELFDSIIEENGVLADDIASVLITVTTDLTAAFPAKAIRTKPGWEYVPVMCTMEIPVPGGLANCIRLLVHANTEKTQREIVHVFQKEAQRLRPDLAHVRK